MQKQTLAGARVLITGARGFIGGNLCQRLHGLGALTHAVVRQGSPVVPTTSVSTVDLADASATRELVARIKPDYIVHLASHVVGGRDLVNVEPSVRDTLQSTINLLTAATEFSCKRIVLAGSLEEPDEGDLQSTVPSSPYAASKLSARLFARMFHSLYKTPVVTTRIFMVYGPGQRDLRKLVPYVAVSLLSGKSPKLSSGVRPVDWVYIDDVSEGLVRCLTAPGLEGKTVDLGSGQLTPVRDVAHQLSKLVGSDVQPLMGQLPDRPMEQVRTAHINRTAELLGFAPSTSLEDGLKRTVDWYAREFSTGQISEPSA